VPPAHDVELSTTKHTTVGGIVRQPDRRAREIRTARICQILLDTTPVIYQLNWNEQTFYQPLTKQ